MIQPISSVNFNYSNQQNFKGRVPKSTFTGFYDPTAVSLPADMKAAIANSSYPKTFIEKLTKAIKILTPEKDLPDANNIIHDGMSKMTHIAYDGTPISIALGKTDAVQDVAAKAADLVSDPINTIADANNILSEGLNRLIHLMPDGSAVDIPLDGPVGAKILEKLPDLSSAENISDARSVLQEMLDNVLSFFN